MDIYRFTIFLSGVARWAREARAPPHQVQGPLGLFGPEGPCGANWPIRVHVDHIWTQKGPTGLVKTPHGPTSINNKISIRAQASL